MHDDSSERSAEESSSMPRESATRDDYLSALSASGGGLLVGIHLAHFSGLLEMPSFASALHANLSPATKSALSALFLLGGVLFAPPCGPFVDRHGRRAALLLIPCLSILSTLALSLGSSLLSARISRLLAGASFALAAVVCPLFLAELAPRGGSRALFVNLYQLAIAGGILLVQISNLFCARAQSWRVAAALPGLPALLMLCAVHSNVRDAPSWIATRGLAGGTVTGASALKGSSRPFSYLLADAGARRRLIVATGVLVAQQLTGINAVVLYAPALVARLFGASAGADAPYAAAALVGAVNFLASVGSLAIVPRYGRRSLLISAAPLLAIFLCLLGLLRDGWARENADIVGLVAMAAFIGVFAVTYGPVPFLVAAEVFPVEYRGVGMTAACMIMNAASVGVAALFLPLEHAVGGKVYYLFATFVATGAVFVAKVVPETRGLSFAEIDAVMR